MAQISIEKKITIKTVLGGKPDIEKILAAHKEGGRALPLMEVYGIANGTKAGITTAPDGKVSHWMKLTGTFMARNLETGNEVRSGIAILPGAANDLISGALGGEETKSVEFGFRFLAQYDASSATNYVYKVEALHQIKENDPLEMLAKRINQPALTAVPTPAPAPEAPKQPEPAKANARK